MRSEEHNNILYISIYCMYQIDNIIETAGVEPAPLAFASAQPWSLVSRCSIKGQIYYHGSYYDPSYYLNDENPYDGLYHCDGIGFDVIRYDMI